MSYNDTPDDKEIKDVYYEARWTLKSTREVKTKRFESVHYDDPEMQLAAALAFAAQKSLELCEGFAIQEHDTAVNVIEIEIHERRMRIFTKNEVMNMLKPKVEGFSEPAYDAKPKDFEAFAEPQQPPEPDGPKVQDSPVDNSKLTATNLDDEIPF